MQDRVPLSDAEIECLERDPAYWDLEAGELHDPSPDPRTRWVVELRREESRQISVAARVAGTTSIACIRAGALEKARRAVPATT